MRLVGYILITVAALCVLLPFCREMLPFRVELQNGQANIVAMTLGLAGLVAVAAGRA